MISCDELRTRFKRDPLPIRWGGIASDLARLSSLAHTGQRQSQAYQDVLTEIKLFSEWMAPEVKLDSQEKILSLQRALSSWLDSPVVSRIEKEASEWSEQILKISGLI